MFKLNFLSIISLFFLMTFSSFEKVNAHSFYVSIAEVEYKEDKEQLEIAIKLTAHDVDYAFEKGNLGELKLGSSHENENANNMLFGYFKEHFKIFINGERKDLQWFGKEVQNDGELYVYLTVKTPRKVKKISFYNDILVRTFPLQENKVIFTAGSFQKSITFNSQHLKEEVFITE